MLKKVGTPGASVIPLAIGLSLACSQATHRRSAPPSTLQQHYEAAEAFQGQGNLGQAEFQYKLFLAAALQEIADDRSHIGDYLRAVPLFDEALKLTPNHSGLRMDYAEAALADKDFAKAKSLAEELLANYSNDMADGDKAKLHRILGQALLGMKQNAEAKEQFAAAVNLDPGFESQYALAQLDLALSDMKGAAQVFANLQSKFGDTASAHMEFGRAYAEADFPEEAIQEYKKVLAKDDRFPGAHYSLGASYLLRSGDTAFPQAEAEFKKELAVHPNDYFSYSQLGYIAMSRRQLQEAIKDLSRAAELDPRNPDNFLLLGGIYGDLGKTAEAENALRKAIAVTIDSSRNHYQIRGAHYQLGLILMQRGDSFEGKKEMQIAQQLLLQNRLLDQVNLTGKAPTDSDAMAQTPDTSPFPVASTTNPSGEGAAVAREDETRIGPAIADSFNNLGAIAAQNKVYEAATEYFAKAAEWNPAMDGLDYNWGRAAYAAQQYKQAVICLERYTQSHAAADINVQLPLGMSKFMLQDYKGALAVFSPIAVQMSRVPLLAYAYAESLIKTGDHEAGLDRLQAIEREHPNLAVVHKAIGEELAAQGKYPEAEMELRTAIHIEPSDSSAKYDLALALIPLGKKDEAEQLLNELVSEDLKNAGVYYELGSLQLAHGNTKVAVTNLQKALQLNPNNSAAREKLAEASGLDSKP
ncbi:tetratricopeptide (TPR) repeat protein [Silvibacterium bohemicum]|uniref:Tetratricopeptide (TPR) repeat protein n=1 Tax=Silvibacterium bohemicum TaxID=1577686 RepID=A0A841JWV6_9BACT|nr:tetratricopeptide repeat protein [Silvibacterium bohemicum]MBB6145852.1 tetratricopeptide (TPR) repeat protein [Silvibacterium bohemicum]